MAAAGALPAHLATGTRRVTQICKSMSWHWIRLNLDLSSCKSPKRSLRTFRPVIRVIIPQCSPVAETEIGARRNLGTGNRSHKTLPVLAQDGDPDFRRGNEPPNRP